MQTGESGHRTAFLDGANAYYIEQLYEQYLSRLNSGSGWKEFLIILVPLKKAMNVYAQAGKNQIGQKHRMGRLLLL